MSSRSFADLSAMTHFGLTAFAFMQIYNANRPQALSFGTCPEAYARLGIAQGAICVGEVRVWHL
jgi:hypothetical protein